MKAVVKSVEPNKTLNKKSGGTYTATVLSVTTEPSSYQGKSKPAEDKEYRIFPNADCHAAVLQLKPGDRIELKMVKDGNYWQVGDVVLLSETINSGQTQSQPPQTSGSSQSSGGKYGQQDPETAGRIARSVAVPAAASQVTENLKLGKKAAKPEDIAQDTLKLSDLYARFIQGELSLDQLPSNFEMPPFTEEEIPPFEDFSE